MRRLQHCCTTVAIFCRSSDQGSFAHVACLTVTLKTNELEIIYFKKKWLMNNSLMTKKYAGESMLVSTLDKGSFVGFVFFAVTLEINEFEIIHIERQTYEYVSDLKKRTQESRGRSR